MNEAFQRPITLKSDGRTVSYGLDDGLLVEFYIKPKLMQHLTEELAQPTYQDRIYTRIIAPGNNKTAWDYETKGLDYQVDDDGQVCGYTVMQGISNEHSCPNRFPKAWERFEKKDQKLKEGWDLAEWGAITRSFAENLKAYNVHTVEALASLTDANADNIMGARKYRDLAKAALDEANILSLATIEQERANRAEEKIRAQDEKIAALSAQIAALQLGIEPQGKRKSA